MAIVGQVGRTQITANYSANKIYCWWILFQTTDNPGQDSVNTPNTRPH